MEVEAVAGGSERAARGARGRRGRRPCSPSGGRRSWGTWSGCHRRRGPRCRRRTARNGSARNRVRSHRRIDRRAAPFRRSVAGVVGSVRRPARGRARGARRPRPRAGCREGGAGRRSARREGRASPGAEAARPSARVVCPAPRPRDEGEPSRCWSQRCARRTKQRDACRRYRYVVPASCAALGVAAAMAGGGARHLDGHELGSVVGPGRADHTASPGQGTSA